MKRRWIQAVVYAFAAFALWGYFDALSGMEPMTAKKAAHYLPAIHAARFGMLLVAACVVSFFNTRYGTFFGLAGCISAGPMLARLLLAIPWRHFFEVLPYSNWIDIYAASLAWVIASVYSVTAIGLLFRRSVKSHQLG